MLSLLFVVYSTILSAGPAVAQDVVVVVNSANPVSSLSSKAVSDILLKRVTKWGNGKTIAPVDQDRTSKIREMFSKVIHRRSVSVIVSYWQTQIFSGKNVPPVIKPTDADVVAFVRANPNAIGYVSAKATLGTNVKPIVVSSQ